MKIHKFPTLSNARWEKQITTSNNGTIFHRLKFLQYHPKNRFDFCNLAVVDKGNIIALLPGALRKNNFISPLGASYGSFVTQDISMLEYEKVIDTFLNYCKSKKLKEVQLTPPPFFYMDKPNEIERFLLTYKGFTVKQHLITNALNIGSLPTRREEIFSFFTPMFRRGIKKSFKQGVYVEFSDDLDSFYAMLVENKKKFNTNPTHSLEEIKKLKKLFPHDIHLLLAYSKSKELVGGLLLMSCNSKTLLAFYISHYYKYQELRAVNRLFFEAILWAKKRSFEWFDLGVSMDTSSKNPMEPSRSLIFFKEGIGTRGFLRSTYYWRNPAL